jgi:hypothetical protein
MKTISVTLTALLLVIGCAEANTHAEKQLTMVDHNYIRYADLLDRHVSEGLVDYQGLIRDRAQLDSLVSGIVEVDLSQATPEQTLAFYINTYNILTLRSIIDAYPVKSIRDINGVWDKKKWEVAGEQLTINEIEHEILRKKFSEPRIHFAIVCASIGCPPLSSRPYLPDSLETQLAAAAQDFATSEDYNRLDPGTGQAELSSIFDWFGDDFEETFYDANSLTSLSKKENAVLNFLIAQFPDDRRSALAAGSYQVRYRDYDWSLNERK